MSLTASLNKAMTGLSFQSRRAEVLSSNVASADTPGYARRALTTAGSLRGASATRQIDPALQHLRREAGADAAGASIAQGFAARLDDMIGDPDRPGSLQALLAKFDSALTVAAADPTSPNGLSAAADAAAGLVDAVTGLADTVTQARQSSEEQIADAVAQLNDDLRTVADLNGKIRRLEVQGQDPSDLQDRRGLLVDRIAEAVPLRQLPRDDGSVALVSRGGVILLDGPPAEIAFTARAYVQPDHVYPADLGGLSVKGRSVGTGGANDGLAGGSLGALFSLRDNAAPEAMARLDAFAQDLVARFQDPGADPSLGPADPGLFTDAGAPIAATPVAGLARRLEINSLLVSDGPERLRAGLGGGPTEPATSNAQLLRFSDALSARTIPLSTELGAAPIDLNGLGGRLRSAISSDRVRADDAVKTARLSSDRLIELRDGAAVDIDAEMQRLLRVEQAYAANARLIQAVGQMMDRITEI